MLKNRKYSVFSLYFCKRITNLSTKDMILQFKVKNFLSIREEQTLDFTASADKTYEDYAVVKIKGVRISKLGVVYGPNASGKSNILKALAWFIFYLVASRTKKPGTGTGLTPFMMDEDSRNQNSSFELIFYIGDVRYEYSVVLNSQKIYKEELYFYPNNRRALFYERTWNEDKSNSSISFGPLLKLSATQKLFIESNCISNATVLTTYKNANVEKMLNLTRSSIILKVSSCLYSARMIILDSWLTMWLDWMPTARSSSAKCLKRLISIYPISTSRKKKVKFLRKQWRSSERLPKYYAFQSHKTRAYQLKSCSLPTRHLSIQEACLIWWNRKEQTECMVCRHCYLHLSRNNQTLLCDELENSLHYDLFTHIIKTFLVNSDRAQLIFSTHSLMLLDEDFIRRDMVYFASKNESGATEIYRAKDFGLHKEGVNPQCLQSRQIGCKATIGQYLH